MNIKTNDWNWTRLNLLWASFLLTHIIVIITVTKNICIFVKFYFYLNLHHYNSVKPTKKCYHLVPLYRITRFTYISLRYTMYFSSVNAKSLVLANDRFGPSVSQWKNEKKVEIILFSTQTTPKKVSNSIVSSPELPELELLEKEFCSFKCFHTIKWCVLSSWT